MFYIKKQATNALNEMTILINYPVCNSVIVDNI